MLDLWRKAQAIPRPTDTLPDPERMVREHRDTLLVAEERGRLVGSVSPAQAVAFWNAAPRRSRGAPRPQRSTGAGSRQRPRPASRASRWSFRKRDWWRTLGGTVMTWAKPRRTSSAFTMVSFTHT